jgi:hypothetical protein
MSEVALLQANTERPQQVEDYVTGWVVQYLVEEGQPLA